MLTEKNLQGGFKTCNADYWLISADTLILVASLDYAAHSHPGPSHNSRLSDALVSHIVPSGISAFIHRARQCWPPRDNGPLYTPDHEPGRVVMDRHCG